MLVEWPVELFVKFIVFPEQVLFGEKEKSALGFGKIVTGALALSAGQNPLETVNITVNDSTLFPPMK